MYILSYYISVQSNKINIIWITDNFVSMVYVCILGLPCLDYSISTKKVKETEQGLPVKYLKVKSNIMLFQLLIIVFECSLLAPVSLTCCVNMQNGGLLG